MTEKQRWLLKELDDWRTAEQQRLGKYEPLKQPKPARVRAAERAGVKANRILTQWEQSRRKPWKRQQQAITDQAMAVRRIILFEKTELALKAIERLRKG